MADEVEFLSSAQAGASSGEYHAPSPAPAAPRAPQAPAYNAPADAGFTQVQVDDDELPF